MKKIAIIKILFNKFINYLKKKEVLLGLLAIFFMIVGFISYNPIANKEYSKIADITNYSETKLGEATLVSSNEVVENVTDEAQTSENTITEEIQKDYFLEARMSRDSIYSESLETYEKLLESSSVTNDQKAIAQNEISNITNEKKTIQSTESLIKMKGFEDVVIFKNSESVSVVVKSDVLLPEQVAQIQNIVEREFKINGKNINITNK